MHLLDSGTSNGCSLPLRPFRRAPGMGQIFVCQSISDQGARRVSPERVAVKTRNSNAWAATPGWTFSPSAAEIAYYEGMIDAHAAAVAAGRASCIYDGEHIDIAHVETARQIVAMAASVEN